METKTFFLDPKSKAALSSIMEATGKDEATCILVALTLLAQALIYSKVIRNTIGVQASEKNSRWGKNKRRAHLR